MFNLQKSRPIDVLKTTLFFDHDRLDVEEGASYEEDEEEGIDFEECSLAMATYCATTKPVKTTIPDIDSLTANIRKLAVGELKKENELSSKHLLAIDSISSCVARSASEYGEGCYYISLPTGMGKTTVIRSALVEMRTTPFLVFVSTLDELAAYRCWLKKYVPLESIGLVFNSGSVERGSGLETVPPTPKHEWGNKRILLACHARADNSRDDVQEMFHYNSYGRSEERRLIYDESVAAGQSWSLSYEVFKEQLKAISSYIEEKDKKWMEEISRRIDLGVGDISLPPAPEGIAKRVGDVVSRKNRGVKEEDKMGVGSLCDLVKNSPPSVRIDVSCNGGGKVVVWFKRTLPVLRWVFVFDANHAYSTLAKRDPTFEEVPLDVVVNWSRVKVNVVADDVTRGRAEREKEKDVLEGVKRVMGEINRKGQTPLFVVKKNEWLSKVRKLVGDEAHLTTWGKHRGSNNWNGCDAVVLVGQLRMRDDDVKGVLALNENNLLADLSGSRNMAAEEAGLNDYQAIARGCCRKVIVEEDVTYASPMEVYVVGKGADISIEKLKEVCPNIDVEVVTKGDVIKDVLSYLDLSGEEEVSINSLVKNVESYRLSSKRDRESVQKGVEARGGWNKKGRSFVRVD